jgi:hypothetical protein
MRYGERLGRKRDERREGLVDAGKNASSMTIATRQKYPYP